MIVKTISYAAIKLSPPPHPSPPHHTLPPSHSPDYVFISQENKHQHLASLQRLTPKATTDYETGQKPSSGPADKNF